MGEEWGKDGGRMGGEWGASEETLPGPLILRPSAGASILLPIAATCGAIKCDLLCAGVSRSAWRRGNTSADVCGGNGLVFLLTCGEKWREKWGGAEMGFRVPGGKRVRCGWGSVWVGDSLRWGGRWPPCCESDAARRMRRPTFISWKFLEMHTHLCIVRWAPRIDGEGAEVVCGVHKE